MPRLCRLQAWLAEIEQGRRLILQDVFFALDLTTQVKNVCDIHKHNSLYCLVPGKMNNARAEIKRVIHSYS